jgi:Ca2+-binding RTX toxin-like protein
MSYFDQTENTYFGGLGFTRQFVVSPIVADVLATNTMYGTPTTTRTGNTTYGFNNNSGRTIYDATTYPSVTYTVVDHGGTDTLDYSGFSQNQRIDLNAEAFSNIGARVGNVTIARGTVIENAIGGSGNDTLIGNAVGNLLDGGTGVSTLTGNAGNDRLIIRSGAAGSAIDGGTDTDTLVVNATTTSLASLVSIEAVELAGGAVLTLTGSQFIVGLAANTQFSGTGSVIVNLGTVAEFAPTAMTVAGGSTITFTINGDADSEIIKVPINIASVINGGDGPDQIRGSNLVDTINGGNGVDKILGLSGADLLTGGADADQFRYYFATDAGLAAAGDTITDFVSGTDKLDFRLFDADLGTAGQQNVSYVGTAAFTGGGNRQVRGEDIGADLRVEVDSNGDGVADMHILLQGAGAQTLTAGDFLFV